MLQGGFIGGFYRFGEIVLFLLYVNFLWICFTLAGLGIFGFGPSTVAMFSIFRKWAMGINDLPVFRTFWRTFRTEFFKANALGITLLSVGGMLYINLNYFEVTGEWLSIITRYITLIAAFVYGIMLIYIFPMYVHYNNTFFAYFKNSILIAVYQPIRTAYIIAACFTLYHLLYTFSIFIFLFGASLTSLIVMWISYRTFERIEMKQALIQTEEQVS